MLPKYNAVWRMVNDTYGYDQDRPNDVLKVRQESGTLIVTIHTESFVDVPSGSVFEVTITPEGD